MTLKPDIVPQALVVDQVKGLHEQKGKLESQVAQLETRMKMLKDSLVENDELEARVNALMAESLSLFEDEWKRKSGFFPDIWLASMEQALAVIAPPAKK